MRHRVVGMRGPNGHLVVARRHWRPAGERSCMCALCEKSACMRFGAALRRVVVVVVATDNAAGRGGGTGRPRRRCANAPTVARRLAADEATGRPTSGARKPA